MKQQKKTIETSVIVCVVFYYYYYYTAVGNKFLHRARSYVINSVRFARPVGKTDGPRMVCGGKKN